MDKINLDSVVVRSGDVIASQVEQDLVMIDLKQGMYYGLNAVSADIWARLEQPVAVSDLCAQLMQTYEVERETCETDVLAVLNDLTTDGLVKLA